MRLFNRVTIIGVGLIGGSIGLAIKRKHAAREVTGVFRRASTMKKALKRKAVDRGTMDMREGVKGADLIIIAAPARSIPLLAREAARYAKPGAVITDAGSTKSWIVRSVEKSIKPSSGISFVGSHPMAGSEHAGVEFAKNDLLTGAPCIVTRTKKTNAKAFNKVVKFWKSLGSKVKVMSPEEHDRTVSMISHLPHIMAFSLAGAVSPKDIACAAEGFKDTTRVASSDPALWADIFYTNTKEIANACRVFEKYYSKVLRALSENKYGSLVKWM